MRSYRGDNENAVKCSVLIDKPPTTPSEHTQFFRFCRGPHTQYTISLSDTTTLSVEVDRRGNTKVNYENRFWMSDGIQRLWHKIDLGTHISVNNNVEELIKY
jgi:hypothetical protein